MGFFNFLNKLPTPNELIGGFGEQLTKIYSKTIPGTLVLHDVLIDGADGYTSQIDLLLIGNKGIYVVEVKSFADAKIYGDAKKAKWAYYVHGKKYEIYSPVKQNQKHIDYLKTFLKDFGDIPCFSLITMICEDFKISGEFDGSTAVCNSLPAMERGIRKLSENKPIVFDDLKKQAIFDYIKNNQHLGREARQAHKQRVIAYKQHLDTTQAAKTSSYRKNEHKK